MGLFSSLFGRKADARLDEIVAGRATERREPVLGLGIKSLGKGQTRGNGFLALTSDELIFVQWVPVREFRVARHELQAGTVRSWLGKRVGADLLHVAGPEDEAAFQVRDLDGWLAVLGGAPRG
jgi:hypothetical protein